MFKNFLRRHVDAGVYLETLFVFAVGTISITRFYLELTNYPKIGSGGLHIAHMLWGGLLLLVSVIMLLSFVNKKIFRIAAILAGIGFGLFIDELGKFITNDNNYFFEPTIALIYIIFIILFLLFRLIEKKLPPAYSEITSEEEEGSTDIFSRSLNKAHQVASSVVRRKWFTRAVIVFFILFSLFNLYKSSEVLSLYLRLNEFNLSYLEIGQFASAIVASIIVILGSIRMKFSVSSGYHLFKIALLISIFLTQFFDFYNHQLQAFYILAFNAFVLFVLQYIINQNQSKSFQPT